MWPVYAAFLFLVQAVWRWTGLPVAGRVLIRALGSSNPNIRTIAGIFLVRAGRRAEPLLEEALTRREYLPALLPILGDIGDRKVEPELLRFAQDRDPQVAQAAQNALRILAAHQ
jgi:HEAT repeat protein